MRALRTYKRAWLPRDLVAGIVLCALLVPQGMAYAELAGLPAITGLYTTIVCLIAYAAFGPSPYLVLGPDSSLSPMIAAVILPLAAGDTEYAVTLAGMLALSRFDLHWRRDCPSRVRLRSALQTRAGGIPGRSGDNHIHRPAARFVRIFH